MEQIHGFYPKGDDFSKMKVCTKSLEEKTLGSFFLHRQAPVLGENTQGSFWLFPRENKLDGKLQIISGVGGGGELGHIFIICFKTCVPQVKTKETERSVSKNKHVNHFKRKLFFDWLNIFLDSF